MKKLVFLMMACVLCLVSCKNNKPTPEPEPEFCGYNYEQVMNEDMMNYGKYVFYESQIHFDTNVCEDSVNVIWIMNVFQNEDTCIKVIHDKGQTEVIKENDFWLEDCQVYYENVSFTLEAAKKELQKLDTKVESKFCTLRRPLWKVEYPHAFYIFGDTQFNHFYAVDSETGEITEM